MEVCFTYKIMEEISKKIILSKELSKKVVHMNNKNRKMRGIKSATAERGIKLPSLAIIT